MAVTANHPDCYAWPNRGPNTNGSQFFISLRACPHLNGILFTFSCHKCAEFARARTILGKHVVFGKVIRGFDDVVPKIAQGSTDEKDRPVVPVIVYNCGELELRKKAAPPRTCIILSFFSFGNVMGSLLLYSSSSAFLPAKEPSVSASSESEDETERRSHKCHKRRQRSRSPGNATEGDDKRLKRKRKHKHQKDEDRSPSRSGKAEPVTERKETEEEYDARLEREENERLAAARKREMERLSREREQEAASTNGVRFKGMFCPLLLQLSLMIPSQDGEE